MAHEGRINTPELDAYIRQMVLPGQGTAQLPSSGFEPVPRCRPAGRAGPRGIRRGLCAGLAGRHGGAGHRDVRHPGRGTARPSAGPPHQVEDDWWGEPQDVVAP
ncbi:hypothetical protein ACFQV4_14855 [Streptomyces thermocarboxydus]